MIEIIKYPKRETWSELCKRPYADPESLDSSVRSILDDVKKNGDSALFDYTKKFDGVELKSFQVSEDEIREASHTIEPHLAGAMNTAAENIALFHRAQRDAAKWIMTTPGVECMRKSIAIERIGLYIPGGSAPLFSTLLMLAIPAKIAGCKEIILCTPPNKSGNIHPAIRYAARITGVSSIFKVGGAQAIAALAFGTESIPKVDKIFGPGNQYVTCAKQMVQQNGMAIDLPAGPSEVLVLAGKGSVTRFVAADLLSQAEHGPDSQVVLLSSDESILNQCREEVLKQLNELPRKEIAAKALRNSRFILTESVDTAMEFANAYAPEHLIIASEDAETLADKVINAGSVFLGNYSPESAGDYASGTNHTLPTNGYARASGGVSLDSFVKKITFQKLTRDGLRRLAPVIGIMAEAEGLTAHKKAVSIRIN